MAGAPPTASATVPVVSEPAPPVAAGRAPLLSRGGPPRLAPRRDSELAKAAGLAGAMVVTNGVALAATLLFVRLLHVTAYGSLAALVSTFLILSVPGAALQVAVARESALGRLGHRGDLAATLRRWTRALATGTVVLSALAVLFRHPLAAAIGVQEEWAAASTITTGCLWLVLSIERGLLQGIRALGVVGTSMVLEQVARLALGVGLALGGLGVTGAYLGSPLAMLVMAVVLGVVLRRRLGHAPSGAPLHSLRELAAGASIPILGLLLVAVLQNIDVIAAKHQFAPKEAGSYAAAAVAAKVVIWVAIGVGFHLVPEAARRHAAGEDPRGVLARDLGLVALVALPALAIFAFLPRLLMRLAFSSASLAAASSLIVLGSAMTLVAVLYLGVQYLLALHRARFLAILAVFAATEPILLFLVADGSSLPGFAAIVLAVQVAAAAAVLAFCLRRPSAPRVAGPTPR